MLLFHVAPSQVIVYTKPSILTCCHGFKDNLRNHDNLANLDNLYVAVRSKYTNDLVPLPCAWLKHDYEAVVTSVSVAFLQ